MIGLTRKLMAVEVAGSDIRAALVSKTGKAMDIIDFAVLRRPNSEDDLPSVEAVRALAERLGHGSGPVVFVTPMARIFDLLMDRKKVAGLKSHQLREAVKWEVEPYTGIAGSNALIGVEPARTLPLDPEAVAPEDEDAPVTVTVSAIERNVYRALKARFKAAGFTLLRVYPPDAVFYMPLAMQPSDTARAILEVGEDYSNFAILRGRVPEQINTLSLSLESMAAHRKGETISPELEESLRFTARQVPAPEPLIIAGAGAADKEVVDYIAGFCANGARPLVLNRTAGITDASVDPAHAVYASAVGAAVRELQDRRGRLPGIDDSVPLGRRVQKSAYLAPLAAAMVTALLLFGHYGFMHYKQSRYENRIRELGAELKQRKAAIAAYDDLMKKDREVEGKIDFARRRLTYLSSQAGKTLARTVVCLKGIADAVPGDIVLSAIVQDGGGKYRVSGNAYALTGLSEFTVALQNKNWCESAVLRKLEKNGGPSSLLAFELTVLLNDEAV